MPYTFILTTCKRQDYIRNVLGKASHCNTFQNWKLFLSPIYLMPYTFTVLVTVLVSRHRYCAVCKPTVMACARISASAAAATRSSSQFCPSNAPQAPRRVAVLAVFSVIYNIPRFFEYDRPKDQTSFSRTQ